jgi:uncharacterized membrane protein
MIYIFAILIGAVAGLRAMTAPAAVSGAAWLGWISLAGTPLAFMGSAWAAGILLLLALVELVNDQRPSTPSRKVPAQFGARLVAGALAGACIGATADMLVPGLVAGIVGAVLGTYAGAALRGALARAFGRDLSAALVEDALAIAGAIAVVRML